MKMNLKHNLKNIKIYQAIQIKIEALYQRFF